MQVKHKIVILQMILKILYSGLFFLDVGSVLSLFLGKIWVCFRSVILNFMSVFIGNSDLSLLIKNTSTSILQYLYAFYKYLIKTIFNALLKFLN